MDSKVEFLFLNEEDMIKAGVLDADRAVDTIGEVITLLSEGDSWRCRHISEEDSICAVRSGMAQMAEIRTRVCRDPYSWRH